jgi:ornithine carbamoyltransferase
MLERVDASRSGESGRFEEIEGRALAQNQLHRDWICNEERMAATRAGRALYMHCLPADIGAEVSDGVLAGARLDLARQANKKLYVIMAALAAAKERQLMARLSELADSR